MRACVRACLRAVGKTFADAIQFTMGVTRTGCLGCSQRQPGAASPLTLLSCTHCTLLCCQGVSRGLQRTVMPGNPRLFCSILTASTGLLRQTFPDLRSHCASMEQLGTEDHFLTAEAGMERGPSGFCWADAYVQAPLLRRMPPL